MRRHHTLLSEANFLEWWGGPYLNLKEKKGIRSEFPELPDLEGFSLLHPVHSATRTSDVYVYELV